MSNERAFVGALVLNHAFVQLGLGCTLNLNDSSSEQQHMGTSKQADHLLSGVAPWQGRNGSPTAMTSDCSEKFPFSSSACPVRSTERQQFDPNPWYLSCVTIQIRQQKADSGGKGCRQTQKVNAYVDCEAYWRATDRLPKGKCWFLSNKKCLRWKFTSDALRVVVLFSPYFIP